MGNYLPILGEPAGPDLEKNGHIRIYANYEVTVNPHLENVTHPLPLIEEIWAALEGGLELTKLDFRQAHNHLQLGEDTKMLVAWSTHRGIFKVNRLPFRPISISVKREDGRTIQGLDGLVIYLDDLII